MKDYFDILDDEQREIMDEGLLKIEETIDNSPPLSQEEYMRLEKELSGMSPNEVKSYMKKMFGGYKPIVNNNKTNRNDPCPCGSGLKYKKCCLK
jgi:uncharacterized protein YecA (UPF0149 family)